VGPMLVPKSSPIAWSHGTQNMVVTTGEFGGDVVFSGHGAGGHPTAVAVMSDVLAVAQGSYAVRLPAKKMAVSGDEVAPHYLRFIVADEPGIVAAIAGALAKVGVNIDSILQHRGFGGDRLPFVVTTEPSLSSTLAAAVKEMAAMKFMLEPPLCLQMLAVDDRETDYATGRQTRRQTGSTPNVEMLSTREKALKKRKASRGACKALQLPMQTQIPRPALLRADCLGTTSNGVPGALQQRRGSLAQAIEELLDGFEGFGL
jgi:predicted amino acid-binding ACT domain protein